MSESDTQNQMTYMPKSYGTRSRGRERNRRGDPRKEAQPHGPATVPAEEFPDASAEEAAALIPGDSTEIEDDLKDNACADADYQLAAIEDFPDETGLPLSFADPADDVVEAKDSAAVSTGEAKIPVTIVGVRFSPAGKVYSFDADNIKLSLNDWVVMKTEKGVGLGQVAVAPYEKELDAHELEGLRKIVRKAGKVDMEQRARLAKREVQARKYCLERIDALGLPMKLVAVECFFDGSKYVFYFTSEGRVDFRELVKQLVSRFPVRIEMRQIGVRHEAKMIGGLACCGQELCCARYLTDFKPVSVRMAKAQNLSLNPTKISGVCGRLMCCLAYEHSTYEDFKKGLPKVGKCVCTRRGEGVVVKHNPLSETVQIKLDEETLIEIAKDEILVTPDPPAKKKKSARKSEKPAEQHSEKEPVIERDTE